MAAEIVETIASKLCSIRGPYHAFVHSKERIIVYNSTKFDLHKVSLAGHDLTSIVTTGHGILIGTTKGTYVQIAYEPSGDNQHLQPEICSIKNSKNKPLFLFGGDGSSLYIGMEWEGPLNRMRCDRVAMVRQGKPSFLPLQGVIVAHQFDSRFSRQFFVMESEEPAHCQLWMVSFDPNHTLDLQKKMYTIDRHSILGDGHGHWNVKAVSRDGHVAFINGGVLYIVDPMGNSTAPKLLFMENARKELQRGCVSFAGQTDAFLIYCTISGLTSLQVCTAAYSERGWKKHTSFVLDVHKEVEGADILESSIVRDSREDANGVVIKLLFESETKGKVCKLIPVFTAHGIEAFEDGDPANSEPKYTGVSLLDCID
jgi:hypothetical protein